MLEYNVRSVRDWEVFNLQRREGWAGNIRFNGNVLEKLNVEEGV